MAKLLYVNKVASNIPMERNLSMERQERERSLFTLDIFIYNSIGTFKFHFICFADFLFTTVFYNDC